MSTRNKRGNNNTRRKRNRNKRRTIPRGPVMNIHDLLGNRLVKLRYSETVTLSNASVPYSSQYIFRGNNIYDPNLTGTGGQPLGFDDFATLYSKYCVVKSAITIETANLGSSATYLVVVPTTKQITIVDLAHAKSLPYAKSRMIGSLNGSSVNTVQSSLSTQKAFGQNYERFEIQEDVFNGNTSGTAPAREWLWNIYAVTMNLATLSLPIVVNIDYWVAFTFPIDQMPS